MKASSAYRTQIIEDSLTLEAAAVISEIGKTAIFAQDERGGCCLGDIQRILPVLRQSVDRLDEIHKMLTEKK